MPLLARTPAMSAAELGDARRRLEMSTDELADALMVTPREIEAWEAGTATVSRRVASLVRNMVAAEEHAAAMEASGLPECPALQALHDRAEAMLDDLEALPGLLEEMERHRASCDVCQAREAYAKAHLPPLPMPGQGVTMRALFALTDLVDRLPPGMRPPQGNAGEGRRTSVSMAAIFSAFSTAVILFGIGAAVVRERPDELRKLFPLWPAVVVAYFVGFYLAGWAVDATRRIRHRFAGYLLRGALCPAAIYGTVGVIMPLTDRTVEIHFGLLMGAGMLVVGALAGAILWVYHRLTGKLPAPVA